MDIEQLASGSQKAFNKLFEQRTLFLKGPLEDDNAHMLVAQMLALAGQSDDDITLVINSPGGIITGMFAIYDTMHTIDAKVNTKCIGLAASAGAFLLSQGTGTRSATENARIMIHQPLGGVRGTAKDIEIQAKNMVWMRVRINELIANRAGKTTDEVAFDTDRDYWMTAAEAKEYGSKGLIDEAIPAKHVF